MNKLESEILRLVADRTPGQIASILHAARMLALHDKQGEPHPIDYQRLRVALWGDPLDHRTDDANLRRMAYATAGVQIGD